MRSVFIRPSVYVLGTSTTEYGRLLEWLKRADCKSVDYVYGGSNPPSPTKNKSRNWGLVFCVSGGSGFERGEHRSVSRSSCLAQQGVGITPSPTQSRRTLHCGKNISPILTWFIAFMRKSAVLGLFSQAKVLHKHTVSYIIARNTLYKEMKK